MVKKLTVLLTEPEFNALQQRAAASCRSENEQARHIIRRSLIASQKSDQAQQKANRNARTVEGERIAVSAV